MIFNILTYFMFGPVELIFAGTLVGFCIGITGVGSSSLMPPILIGLLKVEPHLAIGTNFLYTAVSKFCGSLVHAQKINIVWSIVLPLTLGSIPTALTTHWIFEHYFNQTSTYQNSLTLILGCMLIIMGLSNLFRHLIKHPKKPTPCKNKKYQTKSLILIGVILGFCITISSISTGAIGIMALILMFPHIPMIRLIGSDVAHTVMLTFIAGIFHMSAGNVSFELLMWLLIGSIPAVMIGTLISSHLPEKTITKVIGIMLILVGLYFITYLTHPTFIPSTMS